ncbi:hypothetical protein AKJ41_05415 [candidate division MSBL1 archaeon SCGC-AAA259O05]|uniref:ParB-like N-terminal domain-containing protein n=1 Tax=candidate division MSBL1 archaeon SCGC-AAA259O05 TaxID=1698271 RepID=A0A133UZ21_9EURY|nr:hypothetical protein AKJ41_05415 [candidate division MSBL1 archaeon SCGC-AAA259O05]
MPDIVDISVEKLELDPKNIRPEPVLNPKFVESVTKEIKEPLIVRPKPDSDKYLVTVGERRFLGGKSGGRDSFPCIVKEELEGEDAKAMTESMVENVQRENIPKNAWPDIIREYSEELGVDLSKKSARKKIARKTGLSIGAVYRYVQILGLPGWIREMTKEPDERDLEEWQEGLLKNPSERSDSEKEALEKEGISEEAPSVVEESEAISSSDTAEDKMLDMSAAAELAKSDMFEEIRGENRVEAFRDVLETVEKGSSSVDEILDASQSRVAEDEVKGRKKSVVQEWGSGERQKITIELDKLELEALERMMEEENLDKRKSAVALALREYFHQKGYYEQ